MRIKERKHSNLFVYCKKGLANLVRFIFNKKTKILAGIFLLLSILLIGFLSGLLFSGFFGTFDNPSKKALDLIHSFGIGSLASFKAQAINIIKEAPKAPFNFIKGQFSNPEKIEIDIKFKDYKKLEYKRQEALAIGQLITSPEDYVPARIRYKDKNIKVKLRLKGDFLDHLRGNKWSFRIKVKEKDESLFGLKTFSIQAPKTRRGVNEFIHFQSLKREGVLAPRYKFVEVSINGENKGIYALEEHFDKQLIESNGRREGVIFKFNEDPSWEETMRNKQYYPSALALDKFRDSRYLEWFYSADIDTFKNKKIPFDSKLGPQFDKARSLMELFRTEKLPTHKVFDIDKLAKYFVLENLNGCSHGSRWSNIRYYYNPITSLIEPIGYDGDCWKSNPTAMDKYMIPEEESIEPYYLFFKDPVFTKKYFQELKRMSTKEYLDNLFKDLDPEIQKNVNIIHKDEPFYRFSKSRYYSIQKQIQERLHAVKDLNAYLQEVNRSSNHLKVYIGNLEKFPLKIKSLEYNSTKIFPIKTGEYDNILPPRKSAKMIDYKKIEFELPEGFVTPSSFKGLKLNYEIFGIGENKQEEVFPWRYIEEDFLKRDFIRKKTNISAFDLLDIEKNKIIIKQGNWRLNESLIIPAGYTVYCREGTTIDLVNGALILSYSTIQFNGTQDNPIRIISSDGTGQGLVLQNAPSQSILSNIIFSNLTNPEKDDWILTGAVSIYKSPIKVINAKFIRSYSEDWLNIIHSNYEIKDSIFEHCMSDCFDSDFSNGTVQNTSLFYCGNDCLDYGTSRGFVFNTGIFNFDDKGISAGEYSNIKLKGLKIEGKGINGSNIGISSKDSSVIFLDGSTISKVRYGITIYQKKPEYGPASMKITNSKIYLTQEKYLIEKKSNLTEGNKIILGSKKNIYKNLYGG